MMQDVYIIDGARTPVGLLQGSLSNVSAIELGIIASKGAIERSRVDPNLIDQIVMGNVIQSSKDAVYLPRHIGLKVGIPIETPALVVNRLCGSGFQAIVTAAEMLLLGDGQIALTGGAENMTQAPHVLRGARSGYKFGQAPQLEDSLWEALIDTYTGCGMAITAENLAEEDGLAHPGGEALALRVHQAPRPAEQTGRLAAALDPSTLQARQRNPEE